MKSEIIVVADRGLIRAYRVEQSPTRADGPGQRRHLRLLQALTMTEPHWSAARKFTDEAGAFPVTTGAGRAGRYQAAMAERHLDLEEDRRIMRELAGHIQSILSQEQPRQWALAAHGEIHTGILDHLSRRWRDTLVESVYRDLVNVPVGDLLDHFES